MPTNPYNPYEMEHKIERDNTIMQIKDASLHDWSLNP